MRVYSAHSFILIGCDGDRCLVIADEVRGTVRPRQIAVVPTEATECDQSQVMKLPLLPVGNDTSDPKAVGQVCGTFVRNNGLRHQLETAKQPDGNGSFSLSGRLEMHQPGAGLLGRDPRYLKFKVAL